jgi:hypothetical protein
MQIVTKIFMIAFEYSPPAIAYGFIPIGFGFGTNETSIRQKQPKAIVSFLNPIGITRS